jgi:hypothetical protein
VLLQEHGEEDEDEEDANDMYGNLGFAFFSWLLASCLPTCLPMGMYVGSHRFNNLCGHD